MFQVKCSGEFFCYFAEESSLHSDSTAEADTNTDLMPASLKQHNLTLELFPNHSENLESAKKVKSEQMFNKCNYGMNSIFCFFFKLWFDVWSHFQLTPLAKTKRSSSGKSFPPLGPDTKVFVVWVERFDDIGRNAVFKLKSDLYHYED